MTIPYDATRMRSHWSIRYHFDVTTLVLPEKRDDDELEVLRLRVAELEAVLSERGADVDRVKSDLDAFRILYRQQSARCTTPPPSARPS